MVPNHAKQWQIFSVFHVAIFSRALGQINWWQNMRNGKCLFMLYEAYETIANTKISHLTKEVFET